MSTTQISSGLIKDNAVTPDKQDFPKGADIASAATIVIDDDNAYYDVTGTTTISAITVSAKRWFMLQFDGVLTLTNNAAIDIPGGANLTTAAGDRIICYSTAADTVMVMTYVKASGAPVGVSSLPYLGEGGLEVANDGSDSDHDIDVSVGQVNDDSNAVNIELSTAITKQFDAVFAEGTNAGGMVSGDSLPTNGTIHIFVISKADGTADVLGTNDATSGLSPTLPTGFVYKKRIASLTTDGSANIVQFAQKGNEFLLDLPVQDINTTNPGTSAVLATLSVPTGVKMLAELATEVLDPTPTGTTNVLFTSPDQTDTAPSATVRDYRVTTGNGRDNTSLYVRTNTSGQIRYRVDASAADLVVKIMIRGWMDYF